MQTPDLSRLSDQGRKTYLEGQRIVARKLAAFRAVTPTAQMIYEKALREGKAQIARKLATAAKGRTLATSTSAPTPSAPITNHQIQTIGKAAHTAAKAAAKSYAAKPAEKTNRLLTRHRIFCPGGFTGAKLNGRILG